MDKNMMFSQQCIDELYSDEGFRSCPYKDQGGVATIGIGSTIYENGNAVTMNDSCISADRAKQLLLFHLKIRVLPTLLKYIKVNLNQNMLDGLGGLLYNIGVGNFITSHLLMYINNESTPDVIKKAWEQWDFIKGTQSDSLEHRRDRELAIFYKPI